MIASSYASRTDSLTPPQTPPSTEGGVKGIRNWPGSEKTEATSGSAVVTEKQQIEQEQVVEVEREEEEEEGEEFTSSHQDVLLLHGPKQRYAHTTKYAIPELHTEREMLVNVQVVGLNPIDWKAPDFGFGLPALPCINGRDLAGKVVKAPKAKSRFKKGDIVMGVSTDYRDSRKAAYQQYAVVPDFNACKLPKTVPLLHAAPLGVAFVAAALALGICMGIDFSTFQDARGPNILKITRNQPRDSLPQDIREECFDKIREDERPQPGEWIAIWGGSSASGCCAVQLAKLAGFKVISVIDIAHSGSRMLKHGADLLVDRLDTTRAIEIIKSVTHGKLRFSLDTRGRESAALLAAAMSKERKEGEPRAHLVGLTGLPKVPTEGVVYHTVPIKLFHELPSVGESLMIWLEKLLELERIATPEIVVADGGLEGINDALDMLRDGTVNGPRMVVPLPLPAAKVQA
ncbi:hypothetical protein B7463_g12446, partial [Scytalidium lignicola]